MSIPSHLMEQLLYICRVPSARDALIEAIETGANDLTADEIAYDNTDSGLAATDLQAAVDELAEGAGGSGANTDLSNLVSPTAINQNLLFAKSGDSVVQTINRTGSTSSNRLIVKSGDTADGSTGLVRVFSGSSSGTGSSGSIEIRTGTGSEQSGTITVNTGGLNGTATGGTGGLDFRTGAAIDGNSGNVVLQSGSGNSSGNISIVTGGIGNASISGNTGTIMLNTSDNSVTGDPSAESGAISISTGSSPEGIAGAVDIKTGGGTGGNSNVSSSVHIETGDAVTTSGDIVLHTGHVPGSFAGGISLQAGPLSTPADRGEINMVASAINVNSTPIVGIPMPLQGDGAANKDYVDNLVTGATGTFTAGIKTVTVVNGLITSIV